MSLKLKKYSIISLTLLLMSCFSVAEAATSPCTKVNEIKTIKGKENTCTKVSGKLIWKISNVGISEISLTDLQPIPDGFSIQLANFDPVQKWNLSVSTGEVALDSSGLISVTGDLHPKDSLTLRITKGKFFRTAIYSGEAFILKTIEEPIFAPEMVLNTDGVRIEVSNYDGEKNWEVSSSSGDAQIDNVGILEVGNLESAGNIEITIKISADGYKSFIKTYSYAVTAAESSNP